MSVYINTVQDHIQVLRTQSFQIEFKLNEEVQNWVNSFVLIDLL